MASNSCRIFLLSPTLPGNLLVAEDICCTKFLLVSLFSRSPSVYCVAASRVLKNVRFIVGVIKRKEVSRSQSLKRECRMKRQSCHITTRRHHSSKLRSVGKFCRSSWKSPVPRDQLRNRRDALLSTVSTGDLRRSARKNCRYKCRDPGPCSLVWPRSSLKFRQGSSDRETAARRRNSTTQ